MNKIYLPLKAKPGIENCHGMIGLIGDAFGAISDDQDDPEQCDMAILFYLHQIESIETASFKMLHLAAPAMDQKEIRQLLRENFDEASDDLNLLRLISEHYFK